MLLLLFLTQHLCWTESGEIIRWGCSLLLDWWWWDNKVGLCTAVRNLQIWQRQSSKDLIVIQTWTKLTPSWSMYCMSKSSVWPQSIRKLHVKLSLWVSICCVADNIMLYVRLWHVVSCHMYHPVMFYHAMFHHGVLSCHMHHSVMSYHAICNNNKDLYVCATVCSSLCKYPINTI